MSMMTIAVLLVVRHRTDSYALAGAASAAHTLTQAAATPFVGRFVDRRGQSFVLPRLLAVFLTGITVLVVSAATDGPVAVLFVGAIIAGAGQLPYPSLVRTRWSYLLGNGPYLTTALAFESAADELVFVLGPVLVTALATVNTLLAPIVAGALAVIGTVPFVAAHASEPPTFRASAGSAAWRVPAMWVLIVSSVLIGIVFGGTEVAIIAFSQHHGASGLSGVLLGLIAFGSMVAGLWYGARRWRRDVAVRYRGSLATLAILATPAIAASSIWQMAPASLLIGVSIAPTLIASSALVARVIPPSALTEGFTWQSTGINVGVATGSVIAGLLIDSLGVRAAFVTGPLAAALAALVALAGAGLLAARKLPPGSPSAAAADPATGNAGTSELTGSAS